MAVVVVVGRVADVTVEGESLWEGMCVCVCVCRGDYCVCGGECEKCGG